MRSLWQRFVAGMIMLAVMAVYLTNAHPGSNAETVRSRRDGTAESWAAVGDGVADDGAALQAIIDAGSQNLRLPRGRYRITKPLVVPLDSVGPCSLTGDGTATLLMDGPGPAIRFIGTHEGTASPASFQANVWRQERAPMVAGIEIVGRHPAACGVEATGTMQLTISRVVLRKLMHGIHLVKRNRNVTIANCHIYENHGVGVFYDRVNLHQSNLIGCHVSYNQGGGVVIRGGDVRNVHIGTCDIEGNMGDAKSEPTANVLLDSTGGSIGEVAIVGCTIQHDHSAPHSANIRIDGESTARPFTDETRHGNITIADNVLSDVQVNIQLTNTRGVTITGNTIWKGYQANLQVTNCDHVLVANNMFDRNPRYHYGDGKSARLGLVFEDCRACTISANHIGQVGDVAAALLLRQSHHMNITNCTILDCSPCGVLLEQVTQSRVSDCLIRSEQPEATSCLTIRARGGSGNMIVDNLLGHALQVESARSQVRGNMLDEE